MLVVDEQRLSELREKKISYTVGARLANVNLDLVKHIEWEPCAMARFSSIHGDLVCDFSSKRYKKELNDFNKLVQIAEDLVTRQFLKVRTKFIRKVTKEKIELNTALIEKRGLLLGIKGYCTDLSEQQLSNELVISRYHQLWHVEQSFRMSKFDLLTECELLRY